MGKMTKLEQQKLENFTQPEIDAIESAVRDLLVAKENAKDAKQEVEETKQGVADALKAAGQKFYISDNYVVLLDTQEKVKLEVKKAKKGE